MSKLAAAKALTAGSDAEAIDQVFMDLNWALQNAKNNLMYTFIPKRISRSILSVPSTWIIAMQAISWMVRKQPYGIPGGSHRLNHSRIGLLLI